MATRACAVSNPTAGGGITLKLASWTGLLNTDVGDPFQFPDWADRCIQVFGTFGAGGTLLWEGSNDGTNWATLNDLNGVALSITAASVRQISETPLYVRPRVSAGDGTTSLSVLCLGRRINSHL